MILAPTLSAFGGSSGVVRPTFSRDFAGEKTLNNGTGPAITFTRGSDATYFNAAGTLTTATTNEPRFDHNPSSGNASLGLLIEEARTNIALHSADLANAHWVKSNVTVTSNTDVAPDGTTTADTVEDVTTGSTDNLVTNSAIGGAANAETFTWSFFIKKTTGAANYPAARILFSGGTSIQGVAVIDTNNGTITNTGGSVPSFTASVQNAGSYWRVICTGTNSSTGNTNVSGRIHPAYNLDGTGTQDANATGSIVVWGAQLEKGVFATSYIPTTTAAATRAADSAVVTPISSFYNGTEGTIFNEFSVPTLDGSGTLRGVAQFAEAAAFQNRLQTGVRGTGLYNFGAVAANVGELTIDTAAGAVTAGAIIKAAQAYKSGDSARSFNGGATGASSTSALTTPTRERFRFGDNGTGILNGHIRKVAYWPKRLTNTLLQQLTT